jgi:IS30 family transposase
MGRLELDKKIKISTETAYRFVLQDKAIGGALYKYLRHQHKNFSPTWRFFKPSLSPARTRFKEITNWAKIGFC